MPASIIRPHYVDRPAPDRYTGSHVQTPVTIELMREASRIASGAMYTAAAAIAPGVTTDELDAVAHEYMLDHGAYPSALGYRGFPKAICVSALERDGLAGAWDEMQALAAWRQAGGHS